MSTDKGGKARQRLARSPRRMRASHGQMNWADSGSGFLPVRELLEEVEETCDASSRISSPPRTGLCSVANPSPAPDATGGVGFGVARALAAVARLRALLPAGEIASLVRGETLTPAAAFAASRDADRNLYREHPLFTLDNSLKILKILLN